MHAENNIAPGEPISGKLAVCAFVERSCLFKSLEQEDLNRLFLTGRLLVFEPDELIFTEGHPSSNLYLIMNGTVQVTTTHKKQIICLDQLSRGAIIGVVGLLSGRPRTTSVKALTRVELIAFHRKNLDAIIRNYPKVQRLLRTLFEAQLRKAIEIARSGEC